MEDKRRYPRVESHIPVKYQEMRQGSIVKEATSTSENISLGGVRFKTPDFVQGSSRLIIELDIPMASNPVRAISRVAWIKKDMKDETLYEIGNQFLEISREDREFLSTYIKSLTSYNESK